MAFSLMVSYTGRGLGLAIGNKFLPTYTNLFMVNFENKLLDIVWTSIQSGFGILMIRTYFELIRARCFLEQVAWEYLIQN